MSKVGIICDLNYSRHPLFKSYYYALSFLFNANPKLVTSIDDLKNIDLLFIGDDHWGEHWKIWTSDNFIDTCNKQNLKVVVVSNERMLDSFFPWNKENLDLINQFTNLYHYAGDVDDCMKLGLPLCRTALSKKFRQDINNLPLKEDKIIFLGRFECIMDSYRERRDLLKELEKVINIDIIDSIIPTWEEYMQTIAKYRFVLSPIGNGNSFSMRFFETLAVKSIPIHQIRDNTLSLHDIEATFDDCIYFQDKDEMVEKVKNCTLQQSHNEIWLEDYLRILLTKDGLL